jgi:hypothetical protein
MIAHILIQGNRRKSRLLAESVGIRDLRAQSWVRAVFSSAVSPTDALRGYDSFADVHSDRAARTPADIRLGSLQEIGVKNQDLGIPFQLRQIAPKNENSRP